jgi:hypothetical protein
VGGGEVFGVIASKGEELSERSLSRMDEVIDAYMLN